VQCVPAKATWSWPAVNEIVVVHVSHIEVSETCVGDIDAIKVAPTRVIPRDERLTKP
jgi:hypothetical protein